MWKPSIATDCGCRVALFLALTAGNALALECGTFNFPFCSKSNTEPVQYAGDFTPKVGFGGGDCKDKITRTPVVLIHGNGDSCGPQKSIARASRSMNVVRTVNDAGELQELKHDLAQHPLAVAFDFVVHCIRR